MFRYNNKNLHFWVNIYPDKIIIFLQETNQIKRSQHDVVDISVDGSCFSV